MNKLSKLNLDLLRIILKGFDPEIREYILTAVKYYENRKEHLRDE